MKRLLIIVVCFVFVFADRSVAQENNKPPEGFTALFNGKDLEGWQGMRTIDPRAFTAMEPDAKQTRLAEDNADMLKHWSVENGEIVNDGKGVFLSTIKDYCDYELWIDYKTVADADSGIYLKGTPQVQIWDTTEAGGKWNIGADKGSGGLWNNAAGSAGKDPLELADRPFGEWNRFRILQVGERTSIWLNDKLIVDHARLENYWSKKKPDHNVKLPIPAAGPIQLQTHGGEIRWRNIFVREFTPQQANAILNEKASEGFESVFNGKDFEGWAGPVDNYEIVDGCLRCKAGKGGTIYTKNEYRDFVARLEFMVPAGGNNGLAIRYPGNGDTAYGGMCELQVLDNTADKYAKLDPRQYHGSAYGMVAAHRGYLRQPGEWNFQEVTVQGPSIKVELNGTVILDTDISKVTDFMGGNPHPGIKNEKGSFGFAGHSDPVAFRNVQIKNLNK